MKKILGIEIPDDLTALTTTELADLRKALLAAALSYAKLENGDVTAEVMADIKAAKTLASDIKGTLAADEQATAELAAELAAETAELEAELADPEAEVEVKTEVKAAAKPESKTEDEGENEDGDEPEAEPAAAVVASARPPRVSAAALAAQTPAPQVVRPDAVLTPQRRSVGELAEAGHVFAGAGLDGRSPGSKVESVSGLADALIGRWQDIAGGSNEKFTVAHIPAAYGEDQKLRQGDVDHNMKVLGGRDFRSDTAQRSITAAMCAPVEPYYGLGASSSTERPVKGSLATYRAPRGGVTVYPTPRLGDIVDGVGIWTRANDADLNAVKEACARIVCASPTQYDIYGIYRCMTIKNMLQLTYPELMDAYLNRLAAIQARLAEETMLDAMVGSINTKAVTVNGTNQDASIDFWSTLENIGAVYREEERYDDQMFEFRAHRSLRSKIKMGTIRMRRTSGKLSDRLPTDAEVDAGIRNLGFEPTWTLDYASNWTQVAAQADGTHLTTLSRDADFLINVKGNFRALDEGTLNIGVTNNVMRDNLSLAHNEFTMFFENYEGIIDFGAISWAVHMSNFCPNGAQTGDVTAINCATPGSSN